MTLSRHRHFKIHKPDGYLSQFKTNQSTAKKKNMLGQLADFPPETMAAGRLDEASEGLLILTTDGKVSAQITSSGMEKSYFAQVDGRITREAVEKMRRGLAISIHGKSYQTKACRVEIPYKIPDFPPRVKDIRDARHGPTSWVNIILTEGKYRQVRKMTAAVGFPTLRLVRYRIGDYYLGDLKRGEVREISG